MTAPRVGNRFSVPDGAAAFSCENLGMKARQTPGNAKVLVLGHAEPLKSLVAIVPETSLQWLWRCGMPDQLCDDGDFQAPAWGLGASDWSGRDRLISASIILSISWMLGVPGFLFPSHKIFRNRFGGGPTGQYSGPVTQTQLGPPTRTSTGYRWHPHCFYPVRTHVGVPSPTKLVSFL